MLVKRIAAYTHLSSTVYEYSEILVGNCNFSYSLAFNDPVGVFPLEFREKFGPPKTRIMGLPTMQWRQFDDRLSRFDTIPACDRRTDSQTDRRPAYINNVRSILTHVKNYVSNIQIQFNQLYSTTVNKGLVNMLMLKRDMQQIATAVLCSMLNYNR